MDIPGSYPAESPALATPNSYQQMERDTQKSHAPRGHAHTDSGIGLPEAEHPAQATKPAMAESQPRVAADEWATQKPQAAHIEDPAPREHEQTQDPNAALSATPPAPITTMDEVTQDKEPEQERRFEDALAPITGQKSAPYWGDLPRARGGGIYNTVAGHGSASDDHDQHHHMPPKPAVADDKAESNNKKPLPLTEYPTGGVYNTVRGHGSTEDEEARKGAPSEARQQDIPKSASENRDSRHVVIAGTSAPIPTHSDAPSAPVSGPQESEVTDTQPLPLMTDAREGPEESNAKHNIGYATAGAAAGGMLAAGALHKEKSSSMGDKDGATTTSQAMPALWQPEAGTQQPQESTFNRSPPEQHHAATGSQPEQSVGYTGSGGMIASEAAERERPLTRGKTDANSSSASTTAPVPGAAGPATPTSREGHPSVVPEEVKEESPADKNDARKKAGLVAGAGAAGVAGGIAASELKDRHDEKKLPVGDSRSVEPVQQPAVRDNRVATQEQELPAPAAMAAYQQKEEPTPAEKKVVKEEKHKEKKHKEEKLKEEKHKEKQLKEEKLKEQKHKDAAPVAVATKTEADKESQPAGERLDQGQEKLSAEDERPEEEKKHKLGGIFSVFHRRKGDKEKNSENEDRSNSPPTEEKSNHRNKLTKEPPPNRRASVKKEDGGESPPKSASMDGATAAFVLPPQEEGRNMIVGPPEGTKAPPPTRADGTEGAVPLDKSTTTTSKKHMTEAKANDMAETQTNDKSRVGKAAAAIGVGAGASLAANEMSRSDEAPTSSVDDATTTVDSMDAKDRAPISTSASDPKPSSSESAAANPASTSASQVEYNILPSGTQSGIKSKSQPQPTDSTGTAADIPGATTNDRVEDGQSGLKTGATIATVGAAGAVVGSQLSKGETSREQIPHEQTATVTQTAPPAYPEQSPAPTATQVPEAYAEDAGFHTQPADNVEDKPTKRGVVATAPPPTDKRAKERAPADEPTKKEVPAQKPAKEATPAKNEAAPPATAPAARPDDVAYKGQGGQTQSTAAAMAAGATAGSATAKPSSQGPSGTSVPDSSGTKMQAAATATPEDEDDGPYNLLASGTPSGIKLKKK